MKTPTHIRQRNKEFTVGSIVQSHYAAGWYGRVVEIESRDGTYPLVWVETICTADGRPHRKPVLKRLSGGWLAVGVDLPSRYPELLRVQKREACERNRRRKIRKM